MWKNFFTVAWRALLRDKLYAVINIFGLALGITAFLFIFIYVIDEISYDKYHTKAQKIYRLWEVLDNEGQGERSSSMQFPVAPNLQNDYPHLITQYVRFFNGQQPFYTLKYQDNVFNEEHVFWADTNVLQMFDFPLILGNRDVALTKPNSIVISQELKQKLFGTDDPLNKELILEGGIKMMVTGVFGKIPEQSHFKINALMSFTTLRKFMGNPVQANNWVWNPCWTYLEIPNHEAKAELEKSFPQFIKKYFPPFLVDHNSFFLMPLTDIHLNSHLEYEIEPNGNAKTVFILSVIGLLILVIACINFVNLATARAARRAKEIAVRKVLGSTKPALIKQFLLESFIYSFLAFVLALVIIEILIPSFNQISGKTISLAFFLEPNLLVLTILTIICTGLLSGLYPALFLSSFAPTQIFRQAKTGSKSSVYLRRLLVTTQFTLSFALIIGTIVVNNQFKFMVEKDPGFSNQNIVILTNKPIVSHQFEAFSNQLKSNPNIINVARMNDIMGIDHNVHEYNHLGMQPGQWKYLPSLIVDEEFVPCFNLKLIAGRNFDKFIKSDDTLGVLVNEALVNTLGWKLEEAIGQQLNTPHGKERVIGVVKNFNFVSVADPIQPFVLDMQKYAKFGNFFNKYTAIKINGNNTEQALNHINETWTKFAPQFPVEYFFLNQKMKQQYKAQQVLRDLVSAFALMAILITCIGLFALTSYAMAQRKRETGIRKVLGANKWHLAGVLTKEVFMLIAFSFALAAPLSFLALNHWLNQFAFKTNINPIWFGLTLLIIVFISLITMSYHTFKIGKTDLVMALKWE